MGCGGSKSNDSKSNDTHTRSSSITRSASSKSARSKSNDTHARSSSITRSASSKSARSKSNDTHTRSSSITRSASSKFRSRVVTDEDPWWIKATQREWEPPEGCNDLHECVIEDYSLENRIEFPYEPIEFAWLEEKAGDDQVTPIYCAMGLGQNEAFRYLYKFGCNPNVSDANGVPALHRFIREVHLAGKGKFEPSFKWQSIIGMMQFEGRKAKLEERNHAGRMTERVTIPVDPNVADAAMGLTALMLAVDLGQKEILSLLLDDFTRNDVTNILDVSAKDKEGKTAIDHATEWADPAKWGNDHAELSRRIKIKEQLDGLPAKLRKHALVRAASNGDTAEVASLLDESGALDLNSTLFPGKFKLEGTFKEGCGLGIPGTLGAPPLGQAPLIMFAALHGQEEVVSLLFERGAKAYVEASSGLDKEYGRISPLWLASAAGHEGTVDLLLANAGKDKKVLANLANGHGVTPLIAAACLGHAGVIKKLVAAGADIDHETYVVDHGAGVPAGGATAVHVACWHARDAALDALIELGANIDHTDFKGHTPLFVCVVKTDVPMAFKLLKAGAKVTTNLKRPTDDTLLMAACKKFDTNPIVLKCYLVRRLCEHPLVDVNEANGAGGTALSRAIGSGAPHLVQLLLEFGADVSLHPTDTRDGEAVMHTAKFARILRDDRDFFKQEDLDDANACSELCNRALIKAFLKQIESAKQSTEGQQPAKADILAAEELCRAISFDIQHIADELFGQGCSGPIGEGEARFFASLLDKEHDLNEPSPERLIGLYCKEGAPMTTGISDLQLSEFLQLLTRVLTSMQMVDTNKSTCAVWSAQREYFDILKQIDAELTKAAAGQSAEQLVQLAADTAKAEAEEREKARAGRIAQAQKTLEEASGDAEAAEVTTRELMMKMPNDVKSSLLASCKWGEMTWPERLEAIQAHCKTLPGSPDPAAFLGGGQAESSDIDEFVSNAKQNEARSLIEAVANKLPKAEWDNLRNSGEYPGIQTPAVERLIILEKWLNANTHLGVAIGDAKLDSCIQEIIDKLPDAAMKSLEQFSEWNTFGSTVRLEKLKCVVEQRVNQLVARRPPRRKSKLNTAPCPLTPESSGDWCARFDDGATLHLKLVNGLFMMHPGTDGEVFKLKEVADEEKGDGSKKIVFTWKDGTDCVLSGFDGETITWRTAGDSGTSWMKLVGKFFWDRMDEDDVKLQELKAFTSWSAGDLYDINVCHVHPLITCEGSRVMPIAGTRYVGFDRKAMLPEGTDNGSFEGNTYDLCQAEYDRLPEEKKQLMHALQPGMLAGEALEGSAANERMRMRQSGNVWTMMERMYCQHHTNPWCEALNPEFSPGQKAQRSRSSLSMRESSSSGGGFMDGGSSGDLDGFMDDFEQRFEQALEINMQNFDEQVEAEMRRRLGR